MKNWMKSFLHLVEHTVDFALILEKKELHTVLDVVRSKEDPFGVNVNYTPVPEIMKLNIVDSATIFHVIYSRINMIQSMDRRVLL
jgi:hypothetical protein